MRNACPFPLRNACPFPQPEFIAIACHADAASAQPLGFATVTYRLLARGKSNATSRIKKEATPWPLSSSQYTRRGRAALRQVSYKQKSTTLGTV